MDTTASVALRAIWRRSAGQPEQCTLHGLTHITEQMEAIRDLDSLRCPIGRTTYIIQGAVTGNNLHRWMIREPRGQRGRRPIRQEVDRAASFKIKQSRAVGTTFAQSKITNS